MKRFLRLLAGVLIFMAAVVTAAGARASDGGVPVLRAGVVDKDPKGANMRDAPKGKVIYTIPLKPEDELERIVNVYEQRGEWFRVETEADKPHSGWMHFSVLGLRGGVTEDGPCPLKKTPSEDGAVLARPGENATLILLGFEGGGNDVWLKVRYTDAKGIKHDGWVPVQCQ